MGLDIEVGRIGLQRGLDAQMNATGNFSNHLARPYEATVPLGDNDIVDRPVAGGARDRAVRGNDHFETKPLQ